MKENKRFDPEYNPIISGPILPSLAKFSLPILGALLLQNLYGAVDLLVVSRFAQTADVSGVATGSNVTHGLTMVLTSLATGITVLVGERVGAGNKKATGKVIGNGILLFAMLAVVLIPLLTGFAEGISRLLKAPEEAVMHTADYIRICGYGLPFIMAYNLLGSVFRGLGDSKTPLFAVGIACIVNVFGDLLLVARFHMGAAGAAIATVAAQALSVGISFLYIRRKQPGISLGKKELSMEKTVLGSIVRVGAPLALQELLVHASFLVVQAALNKLGVDASAGSGIAQKITAFIMLVPSALMGSMAAFTAQNVGAGLRDRARKALFTGIEVAFPIGVLLCIVTFIWGDVFLSIFSTDAAVIEQGFGYLKSYALDTMMTPVMFCFIGYFNGTERTLFTMIQGLFGALAVRTPLVLLFSSLPSPTPFLIGVATPISSFMQILLCIFYYVKVTKKEKNGEIQRELN